MVTIKIATTKDANILSQIGKVTIMQSHGHSAPEKDMNSYRDNNFNLDSIKKELSDSKNLYCIIHHNNQAVGYSKIILNSSNKNISQQNVTMLERLYILAEFHDLKLGYELLQHNIDIAKENNQNGLWLNVWIENDRAIRFYKKTGFTICGEYSFRVSETHSNPNYQMFLAF